MSAEFAGAALRWDLPPILGAVNTQNADAANSAPHSAQHLDDIEAAAYQEGLARGHAEGYAAGNREVREQAARLKNLLDHFARPLQELDQELERSLVQLCSDVARRLVNQELELDPQKVTAAVQEAVAVLNSPASELRIHLNPQDVSLLKDSLTLNIESSWKLVPDSTLLRGECRVVSESSRVDARLDTRQENITRALQGDHT